MSTDLEAPEEEIAAAVRLLSIPAAEFRRCDRAEADAILARAMERYVAGNPRAWWLTLKRPKRTFVYDHNFQHLEQHIPIGESRCWFIPETETASRPVFDVEIRWLTPVLNECTFFEYYVLGKGLDWLVIDNDHGELLVVNGS